MLHKGNLQSGICHVWRRLASIQVVCAITLITLPVNLHQSKSIISDGELFGFEWFEAQQNHGFEPFWNDLKKHATDITGNSFCLPWKIDSDQWWTHHPQFEIIQETDKKYCFGLIENPTKRALMEKAYENQWHGNCSNVHTIYMWSSGYGADTMNLRDSLRYGMDRGRPMQVNTKPWHYAAPTEAGKANKFPAKPACPLLTMFCYFLNISNCAQKGPDDFDDAPGVKRGHQWLQDYLLRPQTWLRHKIYNFVKNQTIIQPCTVIHVRRSDVVLHGPMSRKYHKISEYLNANITVHPNIFLLTDDQNAIKEVKTLHPNYTWMAINRPRFKADEAGWERHLPSNDPIFEMVVLQSTFKLAPKCQSFVHGISGLADLIAIEMRKQNPNVEVWNVDRAPGAYMIRHESNNATTNISKAFE